MTKIKIGLFGFGVVGQGIYEVVRKSKNAHAEIVKICVRDPKKPRKIEVDPSLFTTSVDDILDNQNINLVVEVIDDADAAYNIVKRAMLRGIPVVSGSKTMLAKHLPELIEIQKTRNVALLYDASSCGSIPVIRNLEEYYDNDLLLEVKGITESKLEDIKTSYAESRMLQDLMTLLSPFKITPKTALKIYQHFGPASVDILKKSPFELCQVSGFGFLRVDAIVQKNGGDLHDPTRVKGALFWALEDSKGGKGHLFLPGEALRKEALRLLNAKIPVPSLRLHEQEVADVLQDMILHGEVVSVKDNIYLPRTFAQEDETARRIAMRLSLIHI